MTDVYFERLSVPALGQALLATRRGGGLFYFDSTRAGRLAARALAAVGLTPVAAEVRFRLGDLEDPDGWAVFPRVFSAVTDLVRAIAREEIAGHPAIRRMSTRFDHANLVLFVEKELANRFLEPLAVAYAARAHAEGRARADAVAAPRDGNTSPFAPVHFIMRRRPFVDRLAAAVAGIGLIPIPRGDHGSRADATGAGR